MTGDALFSCPDLGLPLLHRGKVREVFDLGDRLLLVATDRLSAFDVVFPQAVPGKGRVLTEMAALWFAAVQPICDHHLLSTDVSGVVPPQHLAALRGRSMIVERARRIDVECVVRGYLAGSAWKEYQAAGRVCGVALPPGLKLNGRLPEPIFTPALKRDVGHDENVSEELVARQFGAELTARLKRLSLELYRFAAERALRAGIILADTKFEFGRRPATGEVILIDEVFTPDSSRFWPADRYREGEPIDSLDKQPVRDYLESIGWNKRPPAPSLPPAVVAATSARYREALARLRPVVAPAPPRAGGPAARPAPPAPLGAPSDGPQGRP